jgi:hypothetical protein
LVALGHEAEHFVDEGMKMPKSKVSYAEELAGTLKSVLKELRKQARITEGEYKECLRNINAHLRIIRKAK